MNTGGLTGETDGLQWKTWSEGTAPPLKVKRKLIKRTEI